MGKKIHNPPPPTGMVRPTPPPSPPRVPRWQDDIDEVKRLTAALVQKQTVIDEMLESLDEAKFTEPELRAKLDKQRHNIKRLKKEIDDFADYRALKREQIARLQSQLADVASYESAALRKRIEQLEAAIQDAICRLDDVDGTSLVSYDLENVLQIAGESEPDTCPECHGTRKTVINKHVGVEDCPVCAQTVEDQDP